MKFIKPEIRTTKDGSQTLFVSNLDEGYHSWHGAVQESLHVYLDSGLKLKTFANEPVIRVFELGLGTGLNAFLTAAYASETNRKIQYDGIEKFPVDPETLEKLNYNSLENLAKYQSLFTGISNSEWDVEVKISDQFELLKICDDFLTFTPKLNHFHVFYFDAFGFRAQSELWSHDAFQKCYDMLLPGGVLVTYASKGVARRTMEAIGFKVERIPGPPGKREMMRATK